MADRSSAALFASIFDYLAKNPDDRAREFARKLWDLTSGYDFQSYQMGCDDSLRTLGLLRDGDPDPDDPAYLPPVYGPE